MKRQKTNPISGGKRKVGKNNDVDGSSCKRVQSAAPVQLSAPEERSHASQAAAVESGKGSNAGVDRAAFHSPADVASTDLATVAQRNTLNSGSAAAAADPFPSQAATPLCSDSPKPDADFLKQTFATNPLFKNLCPEEVTPLLCRFQLASFGPGVAIIREGEKADRFYILHSGRCNIKTRLEGRVQTVGRGDSFGEWALLRNAPRAATVLTEEPVSAWYLDASTFHLAMRSSDRPPAARPPGLSLSRSASSGLLRRSIVAVRALVRVRKAVAESPRRQRLRRWQRLGRLAGRLASLRAACRNRSEVLPSPPLRCAPEPASGIAAATAAAATRARAALPLAAAVAMGWVWPTTLLVLLALCIGARLVLPAHLASAPRLVEG